MKKFLAVLVLGLSMAVTGCQTRDDGSSGGKNTRAAKINTELGKAYLREGNYKSSLVKLKRAINQDPGYAPAHGVIAVLYERLGQVDKAEEHFKQALKLEPGHARIRNNYGAMLCRAGKFAEAEKQFLKSVADPLYRRKEYAYTNAGLCALTARNTVKAEKFFRAALRFNPRFFLALYNMAKLNYEQGYYLPARAFLQRYLQVARQSPPILWLGYRIEKKLGNKNAVASYALLLRSKYPGSRETKLLLQAEKAGGGS